MKLFPDHARAVTDVTRGQVCDDRDDRRDLTAGSPAADALPALNRTVFPPVNVFRPVKTRRTTATG